MYNARVKRILFLRDKEKVKEPIRLVGTAEQVYNAYYNLGEDVRKSYDGFTCRMNNFGIQLPLEQFLKTHYEYQRSMEYKAKVRNTYKHRTRRW